MISHGDKICTTSLNTIMIRMLPRAEIYRQSRLAVPCTGMVALKPGMYSFSPRSVEGLRHVTWAPDRLVKCQCVSKIGIIGEARHLPQNRLCGVNVLA